MWADVLNAHIKGARASAEQGLGGTQAGRGMLWQ
jgi:hypothetical protein